MRSASILVPFAALPLLAACAGGSGSGSDGPARLAYDTPASGLVYTQTDTMVMNIDVGGQFIDVVILSDGVLDMAFAPSDDGARVTATWTDLEVEMTNPMGAPERATAADIDGPVVFDMDRLGRTEMVSEPALQGRAQQMVVPRAVVEAFFPEVPGTPPTPGMTWTDTVAFEVDLPEASTTTRMILDYTVAGDTLVDGRSLLRIDLAGQGSTMQEGNTQGMDFVQDMSGDVTGFLLWDLAAGTMNYQEVESEYGGSMEVTASPMPLGVSMRSTTRVRLSPGSE